MRCWYFEHNLKCIIYRLNHYLYGGAALFLEGRQILESSFQADEAISLSLKRNAGGVICKLDIGKAYDHVTWNFLLFVFSKTRFREN